MATPVYSGSKVLFAPTLVGVHLDTTIVFKDFLGSFTLLVLLSSLARGGWSPYGVYTALFFSLASVKVRCRGLFMRGCIKHLRKLLAKFSVTAYGSMVSSTTGL